MCAILDNMEKENICKNCTYFVQHYAKIDNEFAEVYCGHCINLLNKEKCGYKKSTDVCKLLDEEKLYNN